MSRSFGKLEKVMQCFYYNCYNVFIVFIIIVKYVLLLTLQVKYTQDQKQMKGRPSLILDTPGLRHVKEAQNHISMVGYKQIHLLTTKIY